ncbi:MAG: ATP-dependent RNA helicase dbp7 [Chrysothrix sp. TS-e1954]|nr:MAG: ATP-dependent RNA helicase dbp7 [Chrysothrix sp. TS-e1954]
MANDGMLINFDTAGPVLTSKPTFLGGKWKDRQIAKKSAQSNRDRHRKSNENALVLENSQPFERPVKRQRTESAFPVNGAASRPRIQLRSSRDGRPQAQRQGPHQVISSLFTSNPEASSNIEEAVDDGGKLADPSNAPLKDDLATLTSLGLSEHLAEHTMKKLDIRAPTAVQSQAIPQLCRDNKDAFIQAETGSGKTLAYLLPVVQRIMALPRDKDQLHRNSGLFAIILAPTRELCKQISIVLETLLGCSRWIVSGAVMGGEKKKSEKARLRKGLNILIATPGRLADHLDNTEVLDVNNVRWLVLDEGDRLMELGFEHDIERILAKLDKNHVRTTKLSSLPPKRTTILCSATLKMNVQKLGELSLKHAIHIQAGHPDVDEMTPREDSRFSAPAQLQQSYAIVPAKLRLVSLAALLKRTFDRRGSVMKAVVFMSCSDSVDFHFEVFAKDHEQDRKNAERTDSVGQHDADNGSQTSVAKGSFSSKNNPVRLLRLHGSLPQAVRTSTLAAFRASKEPAVLICTDVASRGLDLPNIDFVVEYDPPFSRDDHLHRVGRTARAGNNGRAMMFLMPGTEEGYVEILEGSRQDGGHPLSRNVAESLLRKGFGSPGIGGGDDWDQRATGWQLDIERWILNDPAHLEKARRAFQSYIRAYATHVASERKYFDITGLHLGHLAKAFGLRDKPGNVRTPGRRPNSNENQANKAERRATAGAANKHDLDSGQPSAAEETKRKMRSKMREQLNQASEFNIG